MVTRGGRLALSRRRALTFVPLWAATVLLSWTWWLNPANIDSLWLFVPLSLALFYDNIVIPSFYLFFLARAKAPARRRPVKGSKVAMITLCVPSSESIQIVEKQLRALKAVKYPHDSWILDEGKSKQIKKLAREHGVKYFSRRGLSKYNLPVYPFMAKTKAGNVNAWLDFVKDYDYDYFVQLDIDHTPKPNYLDKILGHFRDKKVGWVQAPSVYNNRAYWTARGSSEQELGLQGPIQMGFYGSSEAPVVTGSHCTFRMAAIRSIGGFQATRAEDHLNALAMIAKGWKGVYVPEVIAEGEGPETLSAYLTQQYAWARSMIVVLLRHSLQFMKQMNWRRRFQFGFMQCWYPLWTFSYLTLFTIPIIVLFTNISPVSMSKSEFLLKTPILLLTPLLAFWAGRPLMQPKGLFVSWRGALLHLVRWPVILQAFFSALRGGQKPYQVTPKGKFLMAVPSVRLYRPFLMLSSLSAIAVIFGTTSYGSKASAGQLVFALVNALIMLSVCVVDIDYRLRRTPYNLRGKFRYWLAPISAISVVTILAGMALALPFSPNQSALAIDTTNVPEKAPNDLSQIPPRLLNDEQLMAEIKNPTYRLPKNSPRPSLGIYEPNKVINSGQPYIRSTFADWQEHTRMRRQLLDSLRVGATPLMTIEPHGELDGHKLLVDIDKGIYDERLNEMLDVVGASPNTVYIRFAHEMEEHNSYAWGGQDPITFIKAYRHVIDLARSRNIDNIKWVWAPIGANPSSVHYYPGDKYVDVVGVTIIYVSAWYDYQLFSFQEFESHRNLMKQFNKPIWITEYGVENANPLIQQQMVRDAVRYFKYEGYQALIYINMREVRTVHRQRADYRLPDLSPFGPALKSQTSARPVTNQLAYTLSKY